MFLYQDYNYSRRFLDFLAAPEYSSKLGLNPWISLEFFYSTQLQSAFFAWSPFEILTASSDPWSPKMCTD
ncbi:hypothetical protein BpHYR1_008673 [Brachionus plicatilis]|uniref:Uncharacterized protein n=1 Tax=Brachionus plicatilis TaxID=10195 RepID=A0A3M7QFV5_BRAPC|nr:hypothetical protein BpHYR1_008673 [Brachionus plicatilis]